MTWKEEARIISYLCCDGCGREIIHNVPYDEFDGMHFHAEAKKGEKSCLDRAKELHYKLFSNKKQSD